MTSFIGLNEKALAQVSSTEKLLFKIVNWSFLLVVCMSLASNSYFGYLLTGKWYISIALGVLMGFIHFSVLRISLITLVTKPVVERKSDTSYSATTATILDADTHNHSVFRDTVETPDARGPVAIFRQLNFATCTRIVFIGLIAVTICLPLSTMFFHNEAGRIQDNYRKQLISSYEDSSYKMQPDYVLISADLTKAHYPFVVIEQLWYNGLFKILVFIFFLLIYVPSIVLARLRFSNKYRYADLVKDYMRNEIRIDYQEAVWQSQYYLDKCFPEFDRKLSDLTAFTDPPFKQVPRMVFARKFESKTEFYNHMRSL